MKHAEETQPEPSLKEEAIIDHDNMEKKKKEEKTGHQDEKAKTEEDEEQMKPEKGDHTEEVFKLGKEEDEEIYTPGGVAEDKEEEPQTKDIEENEGKIKEEEPITQAILPKGEEEEPEDTTLEKDEQNQDKEETKAGEVVGDKEAGEDTDEDLIDEEGKEREEEAKIEDKESEDKVLHADEHRAEESTELSDGDVSNQLENPDEEDRDGDEEKQPSAQQLHLQMLSSETVVRGSFVPGSAEHEEDKFTDVSNRHDENNNNSESRRAEPKGKRKPHTSLERLGKVSHKEDRVDKYDKGIKLLPLSSHTCISVMLSLFKDVSKDVRA